MQAKFTQGSILHHINIMTLSSTIGLLSLFLVDLVDVYFLNLLGVIEITAAVGFSGSILFFTIAIGIGLAVGCGARVSQIIGTGDRPLTKRTIAHSFVAVVAISLPVAAGLFLITPWLLTWLGADGLSQDYAIDYIRIILPSLPLLALAMACGGIMRALGEARSAMLLTLFGAIVNAVLDPLFIFVLNGEIKGAAWATVLARVTMFAFGLWTVAIKHQLLGKIDLAQLQYDMRRFFSIAFPAMLTNLSTPIGYAFITATMASFGNEAVAGSAMISRTQSVAFAGLFALSGAVGPIAGQNLGAGLYPRILQTLNNSLLFVLIYSVFACSVLFLLSDYLILAFHAEGLAADIIRWFCYGFSLTFFFNGITFVCNALLNNLHAAHVATQFNFAKATLGTMPFVYFGAQWGGPIGIFWGALIGAIVIAAIGAWYTRRHIITLSIKHTSPLSR